MASSCVFPCERTAAPRSPPDLRELRTCSASLEGPAADGGSITATPQRLSVRTLCKMTGPAVVTVRVPVAPEVRTRRQPARLCLRAPTAAVRADGRGVRRGVCIRPGLPCTRCWHLLQHRSRRHGQRSPRPHAVRQQALAGNVRAACSADTPGTARAAHARASRRSAGVGMLAMGLMVFQTFSGRRRRQGYQRVDRAVASSTRIV